MALGLVLRAEEMLQHAVARRLLRQGRNAEVRPLSGFGSDGWLQARARVVVGASNPPERTMRAATTWQAIRANLVQFVTFEVPCAQVRVEIGDRNQVVNADREGYVDVEMTGVRLEPGRSAVTFTPVDPPGRPARGDVHVPDPSAAITVVSDIDDTIIDSGIAHGLIATITTAVLRDSATRVPLDGAPLLYQALARDPQGGPERAFFYLSTSPWNLVAFLRRFIEQHHFPAGPLLLTDWGPGSGGWFRMSTRAHKLGALRRLADRFPGVRFVLLGDSGQEDVEIYTAFAVECPGRVAAVYVRRAGTPPVAKRQRIQRCAQTLRDAGVPFVLASDSAVMLRHAQDLGLAHR